MAEKQSLIVRPRPNTGLFEIASTVGPIPDQLKGMYSSQRDALIAINRFRTVNFKNPKPYNSQKRKVSPKKTREMVNKINEGKIDATTGKYQAS